MGAKTYTIGLVQDQDVIREFETGVSAFWEGALDADAYRAAAVSGYRAAVDAVARGVAPTDPEGVAAGRAWLDASARAMGRAPDDAFAQWLQDQYAARGGRDARLALAHRSGARCRLTWPARCLPCRVPADAQARGQPHL